MESELSEFILVFQTIIQWLAIILSASTGVYDARRNGMDYFGALVIAVIVAVGGGTLRDILLGRYPLFWLQDPIYLISIFIVGVIGIILVPISTSQFSDNTSVHTDLFHALIRLLFGSSD